MFFPVKARKANSIKQISKTVLLLKNILAKGMADNVQTILLTLR
jgi:hypothetical protein